MPLTEHQPELRFHPRSIGIVGAGTLQGPDSAFRRRRSALNFGASLGSKIDRTEMRR